ncbi:MAG: ZIP family metal transporter [bacterium]|nr:ZIP family metal transporter [bacterium]
MSLVWLYSIGSALIISLIAMVGVVALALRERFLRRIIFVLVSLSVGVLFGDVFIHLLPKLAEEDYLVSGTPYILGGLLVFFILEKFMRWRHSHGEDISELAHQAEEVRAKPIGAIVLVGDGVHNFIDGVIIAGSYMVSVELGIATTLAVALHEIPQEIGDFGILLHAGFRKTQALFFNFLSALFVVLGVFLALLAGSALKEDFIFSTIAIAAGGFIYIAGSDLVPELHKTSDLKKSLIQLISILTGFALMALLTLLE